MFRLRIVVVVALGMFVIGNVCCWGTRKMDYDKVIAELTEKIQAQPQNRSLYLARGRVYADKGDFDKAIVDYTKAIELNPDDDNSFELRGKAYYETGELRKAIDDYVVALRINPKNKVAKQFLTSFAEHLDIFLKAIQGEEPEERGGFVERMPEVRTKRLERNVSTEDVVAENGNVTEN